MNRTQAFMVAATKTDDPELTVMVRTSMMNQPGKERLNWLKQIELGLDGYGGDGHTKRVERISDILRVLEIELKADASLIAG